MSVAMGEVLNIKVGDSLPGFELPVHTGGEVDLGEFRDKSALVLFYYPKANTSG